MRKKSLERNEHAMVPIAIMGLDELPTLAKLRKLYGARGRKHHVRQEGTGGASRFVLLLPQKPSQEVLP